MAEVRCTDTDVTAQIFLQQLPTNKFSFVILYPKKNPFTYIKIEIRPLLEISF